MSVKARMGWLALALVAGVAVQQWLDRQLRPGLAADDRLYLTSGETLRRASFGFHGVLADWYWIRTLHYFGSKMEEQRRTRDTLDVRAMPRLRDLLGIVVALDPRHVAAYRFGAFFLAEEDPEYALYFAREGLRDNPREWRLYHDIGFLYWRLGKYREAAQSYERGARIEGAPLWMRSMAATMLARGGERETARAIFTQLIENTDDRFIREVSREQLKLLDQNKQHSESLEKSGKVWRSPSRP